MLEPHFRGLTGLFLVNGLALQGRAEGQVEPPLLWGGWWSLRNCSQETGRTPRGLEEKMWVLEREDSAGAPPAKPGTGHSLHLASPSSGVPTCEMGAYSLLLHRRDETWRGLGVTEVCLSPSGCHIEMQTLGKPCASVSSFV